MSEYSKKWSLAVSAMALLTHLGVAQDLRFMSQLPSIASESSGIEESGNNKIWTFNDSGGNPELYLCDTLGNLIRTVMISNAWNRDWEDITQDNEGNFYIGNIGNNDNDNTDLTIFKIPNPDTVQGSLISAEIIDFSYEDQYSFPPPADSLNFDCETLFWFADHLYLCTKNRTVPFDGKAHLYRLPDTSGSFVAEKIGIFETGGSDVFSYWITAGDISPDDSKLCLLSNDRIWLFFDFVGDDFFSARSYEIELGSVSQKEAICFINERKVYITDEELIAGLGRNLYSLNLDVVLTLREDIQLETGGISLFPNPCDDWIVLEGDLNAYELDVLDVDGSVHQRLEVSGNQFVVQLKERTSALFFIRVRNKANGNLWVEKIISMK